jgi:hypothetical protein
VPKVGKRRGVAESFANGDRTQANLFGEQTIYNFDIGDSKMRALLFSEVNVVSGGIVDLPNEDPLGNQDMGQGLDLAQYVVPAVVYYAIGAAATAATALIGYLVGSSSSTTTTTTIVCTNTPTPPGGYTQTCTSTTTTSSTSTGK